MHILPDFILAGPANYARHSFHLFQLVGVMENCTAISSPAKDLTSPALVALERTPDTPLTAMAERCLLNIRSLQRAPEQPGLP